MFFSPDLELFRRGLLQLDQLSAHQSPSQDRALQQCFMSCSLPDKGGSSLEPVLLLDLLYRHWMARQCWTGWQMCHCSHTAMAAAALASPDSALGELHSVWAHFKPLFFSGEVNQTQQHISNPTFYSLSGICTAPQGCTLALPPSLHWLKTGRRLKNWK